MADTQSITIIDTFVVNKAPIDSLANTQPIYTQNHLSVNTSKVFAKDERLATSPDLGSNQNSPLTACSVSELRLIERDALKSSEIQRLNQACMNLIIQNENIKKEMSLLGANRDVLGQLFKLTTRLEEMNVQLHAARTSEMEIRKYSHLEKESLLNELHSYGELVNDLKVRNDTLVKEKEEIAHKVEEKSQKIHQLKEKQEEQEKEIKELKELRAAAERREIEAKEQRLNEEKERQEKEAKEAAEREQRDQIVNEKLARLEVLEREELERQAKKEEEEKLAAEAAEAKPKKAAKKTGAKRAASPGADTKRAKSPAGDVKRAKSPAGTKTKKK